MENLMNLWNGLQVFWSISVALQLRQKKTGLMDDAMISTWTWLAHKGEVIHVMQQEAIQCVETLQRQNIVQCQWNYEHFFIVWSDARRQSKEYHMTGADFAAMLLCNPKQRFFVEISMRWQWYPYSSMAEYPFDVRLGAFQGHSNQVVDPTVAHHQLTYDEAMSLGWIFHVTDFMNLDSIQQSGLKTFVKGSGKGRRDAVHFMVSQWQWSGLHKDGRGH